ncbi:condensation domain-containing protein [Poseidonocella sp. HB161398]|uniref:condensation domain-containing protein n=1 Tax=Poseidonocella sp. HB161398 TaxID=2320855 RepID=UPI0011093924|nr:condensation domain-containing protein [Poseidonocella sp. HB161398]
MQDTLSRGGRLPLTLAQLDFWEEFRFHPGEPVSTVGHAVRLEGDLDAAALARAIATACAETDVLALRFHDEGGRIRQSCDPGRAPELLRADLRGTDDPEAEAQRRIEADMAAVLDLGRDPLSVQWLLRTGDRRWLWYNRGHHIMLDGYGVFLIEQRVAQLYRHFASGGPAGTPFRPFAAFLEEETAYRAGPAAARDGAFWREALARPVPLPVLEKGGEDYAAEGYYSEPPLDPGLPLQLSRTAAETGTGWPDLLVLASAAYLHRHLPREEAALPVWLPFMSRLGSVSALVPCLAVNILPLFVTVGPEERFGGYLARMQGELRRLRRHGRYRIEQIAADHGIGAGRRFFFSPLVNVMPFDPPEFPGCRASREVLANGPADGFNLSFRARRDGEELALGIDGDPALTSAAEFARHEAEIPAFLSRAFAPGGLETEMGALLAPR